MPCVCVRVEVHLTDDLHVKINMAAMTYVDMHQMRSIDGQKKYTSLQCTHTRTTWNADTKFVYRGD
jgi:hypothetical protein